jgi:Terminase small subunit
VRYFDSQVGRFISQDPIGFSGGDANVYRYSVREKNLVPGARHAYCHRLSSLLTWPPDQTHEGRWRVAKRPKATASKELTPRQIIFAKHFLTGATITEAARRAGYSKKNLAQSGHQALQTIRLKCPELMARLELTPSVLIEKYLVPLLSATKTKFFQYKGKIIESRASRPSHPADGTRHGFELMGAYAPNQSR